MRRNPRPIPLDEEYIEDLTDTMLLGYYRRLDDYRGLPIFRSKLIKLRKTLPRRFKGKPCNDEELEWCVPYKTAKYSRTVPVVGMYGYPRFPLKPMTDVRGIQLPLVEISTKIRTQVGLNYQSGNSLEPTDIPFIAAAAIPNKEGLTTSIFVALNGDMTPQDFVEFYENDYNFLYRLLYQILIHELTHARDVISLDFLGFMGGMSYADDRNTKVELRARLREIIEDVKQEIGSNGFGWLRKTCSPSQWIK